MVDSIGNRAYSAPLKESRRRSSLADMSTVLLRSIVVYRRRNDGLGVKFAITQVPQELLGRCDTELPKIF